ncbi:MAG: DNA topoisomerase I [Candidatus Thorarchaeota archaeon]
MIISEKPTAAKKIAQALDENGRPEEVKKRGASYFECTRDGDSLLVVYAVGHLFELRQTEKGWTYPRLEIEWVPKYEVVKKATHVKPIINLIKRLSKDVDQFIIATDFDIEGSLIGYLTLKFACKTNPEKAQRMVFSSLTQADLEAAYVGMQKTLDFPRIFAGHVRHEIDWLYGINLTRALTLAIKKAAGWFKIVSTGRVQGPVLAYVAQRDKEINVFVPTPYWNIATVGDFENQQVHLEYNSGRVSNKREADSITQDLVGREGLVSSVKRKENKQSPPPPFNLSTLQSECYRHFGFKPSRTLALAQALYLDALISYPRTNSQKIPPQIDIKSILKDLSAKRQYKSIVKIILDRGNFTPVQGKANDPAHPAIHPTGNKPTRNLTPSEKKVFDLIVRRFLALFGETALKESLRINVDVNGHLLFSRGLRILKHGWMEFYGKYATQKERILPQINEGDKIPLTQVETVEKRTAPPNHYNPSSLLKVLEKENLGTKSTRAGIVDSVRSRGYTLNNQFEMSTLGYAIFETLERFLPIILSSELTRRLESEMEGILQGKEDRENVLAEAKKELLDILQSFQSQDDAIGQTLVAGLQRYWREREELGPCPKCGDGKLTIVRSHKTGKRFVGCSNYKDGNCDQTFPLPQKGVISPIDKTCPHCGYQMIKVVSGRRGWETCVNWVKCPGRQDELKELEKKRASKKTAVKEEVSK